MPLWPGDAAATARVRPGARVEYGHIVLEFGRHAGKLLYDLPDHYLRWVSNTSTFPDDLRKACVAELRSRGAWVTWSTADALEALAEHFDSMPDDGYDDSDEYRAATDGLQGDPADYGDR